MTPQQANLLSIGSEMSNVLWNLGQHKRREITEREGEMFYALAKKWDEARRAPAPTEPAVDRQPECGACHGSGWVPRDPDIGTEQECFCCGGSGVDEDAIATQASPAVPAEQSLAVASGQTALDLEAVTRAWMTARGYGNVTSLHAMCDLQARVEKLQAVPAPAPLAPYDALFNAIAAGTVVAGNAVAVSVKDFTAELAKQGYTVAPQLPQASQPTSAPDA